MKFDFLPELPSSNLDDRQFDDLVEESLMRIPRYCPEWTDHNLSDPGVTFVELFAWLTDQMLLRFNQVPRKNYIAFLELLGIRLQPPAPAHTELTFYLSSALPEPYTIPKGLEVATVRTETKPAVIFSTDSPLVIGQPRIQHFLTSQIAEENPQSLQEGLVNGWDRQNPSFWTGNEQAVYQEQPQIGNCFYLVINGDGDLDANVIDVTFQGAAATPTGINPNQPPRTWEAWDGEKWQPVLLKEADDHTKGFSFHELEEDGVNAAQGADVRLHLPQTWPVSRFRNYRGRWLRCRYITPTSSQGSYQRPPRITGVGLKSIGGTVRATHSSKIEDERLGISNGKPGQRLQLLVTPVLERQENEYIIVTPPGGLPQTWQEVGDFADSGPEDHHYTIDSITGTVQFGPLIREPGQLKQQKTERSRIQQPNPGDTVAQFINIDNAQEHQYGAVPSRGAEIRMMAYRTGGGKEGNVESGSLQLLRSAFPYIESVTNHKPAINGGDGESLEQAVIRAPRILRSRDRAVTPEDFEVLAKKGGGEAIARVRCLPANENRQAGTVGLVIVPNYSTDGIELGEGLNPDNLALTPALKEQVLKYLNDRKLLGVQIQLQEPEYVGVSVQTEVIVEPAYNNPLAREEILNNMRVSLYKYLNPLTGGMEEKGWPFGRPVYISDIIALMQKTRGVRYLGQVHLFEIRKQDDTWVRISTPQQIIDPGTDGLICSWTDSDLRSSHNITIT